MVCIGQNWHNRHYLNKGTKEVFTMMTTMYANGKRTMVFKDGDIYADDFVYNDVDYEKYGDRYYYLDVSKDFTSRVAREGGLVRRRISKTAYEEAKAAAIKEVEYEAKTKEIRQIQKTLDERTKAEKEAEKLISECRFEEAMELLAALEEPVSMLPKENRQNFNTRKEDYNGFLQNLSGVRCKSRSGRTLRLPGRGYPEQGNKKYSREAWK